VAVIRAAAAAHDVQLRQAPLQLRVFLAQLLRIADVEA
jgi:hypothetical protein